MPRAKIGPLAACLCLIAGTSVAYAASPPSDCFPPRAERDLSALGGSRPALPAAIRIQASPDDPGARPLAVLARKLGQKLELSIDRNSVRIANEHGTLATQQFEITAGELAMGRARVEDGFQRNRAYETMLTELLALHPEIRSIYVNELSETNKLKVEEALDGGKTLSQAIRLSPAYVIRERNGFSRIVPGSIDPITYGFTVTRP